ncbi:unnamed protein product [Auanema sp. JU1783]|nr:unnamed protein product [Auanema sp. JU1783]
MQTVWVFLLVLCIFIIIFLNHDNSKYEESIQEVLDDDKEKFNTNIDQCVPNYTFYEQMLKGGRGNRKQKRTPLLLLAAYEYVDHVAVTIQSDGWYGQDVYCRYLNKNFEEISQPMRTKVFPEWTVMCCNRDNVSYMSITTKEDDDIVQHTKLLSRKPQDMKYELSVCLAPIYGNETKWLLLAETIEHFRIQRVDHFYLYIKDIDSYSRQLVDYYVQTGIAEAIYFENRQDRPRYEWHLTGVQDCLQRSKYESRYAMFIDIDERIVTSKPNDLLQVTRNFFQDKKVGTVTFRPRWIFRNKPLPVKYEGEKTLRDHLPTLVFHNTTHVSPPGHTVKAILNPIAVLSMWIHWPMHMYPGFKDVGVPPAVGYIRHYRDVFSGDWGKKWMPETLKFGKLSSTDYPPSLMPRLFDNVKRHLDLTYGDTLPNGF